MLDIQPSVDFVPPTATVLQVFGERHEWTVILQAVSLPDLVRKKVKLVVAHAPDETPAPESPPEQTLRSAAAVRRTGDSLPVALHAISGRGVIWLTTAQDSDFKRASQTILGARASRRLNARIAAALDLSIAWSDQKLRFTRSGKDHDLRPLWLQAAVQMRARTKGDVAVSAIIGAGARYRMAGELLSVGEVEAINSMAGGVFTSLGVGLQRRMGRSVLGVDVLGEVGSPDEQWSIVVLFHLGCFAQCGG
ncbi:hypothetical protein [Haliangium ochraceum]|uniref:hypothetical protein n=1 Tax=Haliangium ochraceum TaxID=80816 RepID=UPI001E4BB06A|nr:hypothetical protein [Haliangium ochraceum]